jgi:hypothetical protein
LTTEDKAMEGIAIATAPLRWLASLVKTVILFAIGITCLLGYPFYLMTQGEPVSAAPWVVAGLTLLFLFTLCYAPSYTACLLVATFFFLILVAGANSDGQPLGPVGSFIKTGWNSAYLIFAALVIGIVQSLINGTIQHRDAEKEEERQEATRRAQEDEDRKSLEAENRKRATFRNENKDILASISELLSSCGAQAKEMLRAVKAIEGGEIVENPERIVMTDIARILVAFRDTDSPGDSYLEMLWRETVGLISPPTGDEVLRPLFLIKNEGVKRLGMVSLLVKYDKQQRTHLASKAASTYLSILSEVRSHCGDSVAVRLVANAFIEQLRPYANEGGGDGYDGGSTSSAGSQSNRRPVCQKCIKDFEHLGLPVGASKDEVRQKRRDCADVLHPDMLGGKSERARNAAEQQLKIINAVCDRLLSCLCAR